MHTSTIPQMGLRLALLNFMSDMLVLLQAAEQAEAF